MRVLITAAGLIGCYAGRALLERGDEVAFFEIAPQESYIRGVMQEDARVFRGDVRDLPAIIEAIRDIRADAVVHTANVIGNVAQANPYRGFQTNIGGSINIAEAVRLMGVKRLIYLSTHGVHDLSQPQKAPLTEDFPVGGPGTVYSNSKVACEQVLRAYAACYSTELAILRPPGVYGYGHFAGGSGVGRTLCDMLLAAEQGKHAPIGGGVPDPYELVSVRDVAEAVALAVHAPRLLHDVFHIGTGVLTTTESLVQALQAIYPGSSASRSSPARPDRYPRLQPLDLSRSRSELGYEPKYNLVAGMRDLIAEMKRLGAGTGGK